MKFVNVTQWVRVSNSSPTRQMPSQQVGSELHVLNQ
jgi:hypothetical protein